jgi:predicted AAA+ superfamily ATPase
MAVLTRMAEALERLAPPAPTFDDAPGWAFGMEAAALKPIPAPQALPLDALVGLDRQKEALIANTVRFAQGHIANNALLWGARGVGKSALVKAVVRHVAAVSPTLKLVQIRVDEASSIPAVAALVRASRYRVILFLDDLSLDADGPVLRALKPALDGGLASAAGDILVYATSNRRHLTSRKAAENHPEDLFWRDTAEDRLAISDRFGLSLGFHAWDQETYLAAIESYATRLGLETTGLKEAAIDWALERGARSGRTAWQFIIDQAGRAGIALNAQL